MLTWTVLDSSHGSDHFPIVVKGLNSETNVVNHKYKLSKADWKSYRTHDLWKSLPTEIVNAENQNLVDSFYKILYDILNRTVPKHSTSSYFPKPWWCDECKDAKRKIETAFKHYKRNKTLQNYVTYKRLRAEFTNLVKIKQGESWINKCNKVNINTPMSEIYSFMRSVKGKSRRFISTLKQNDEIFSTIPEITNKLGNTFATISSSRNSPQRPTLGPVDFTSTNQEEYNAPFSQKEFLHAVTSTKDTAPGQDLVSANMIKNMPLIAKQYLLSMYNKFWINSFIPDIWKIAIIIPIPKPGKDSSNPLNYRPIALTSVLCKIFERMVNARLLETLELNRLLSPIQCGGRRNRSCLDLLTVLENQVRTAFSKQEHLVSVFFDIEKAYDTTWRRGILRDLFEMKFRGSLPNFVEKFFFNRKFKVRIGNHTSKTFIHEEGVPQGSVISVTLFLIKINSLVAVLPSESNFSASLFIDDLQISYRHSDTCVIERKIQDTISSLETWAINNGFKFSSQKTKALHFSIQHGINFPPDLHLYGSAIEFVDHFKFLGLIWDTKLNYRAHIHFVQQRCNQALNMLKTITSNKWGADHQTLLHLYKLYVRSKIDYGFTIYGAASQTAMQPLKTIHNSALRVISGSFKSTPINSLHIITNEMPLKQRYELLSIRYYLKIRSHHASPAFRTLGQRAAATLFRTRNLTPPFTLRTESILQELNFPRLAVKPSFSYRLLNITIPQYVISLPDPDISLLAYDKNETDDHRYQTEFRHLCCTTYNSYNYIIIILMGQSL